MPRELLIPQQTHFIKKIQAANQKQHEGKEKKTNIIRYD